MSNTIKTVIDGYNVDLEIDVDEEPSTQCHVETSNGRYGASIECLIGEGLLTQYSAPYSNKRVSNTTIDKIEAWADKNGY
jgi:hypothetical protein